MSDNEEIAKWVEYIKNGPPKPRWEPPARKRELETYRRAMIEYVSWNLGKLPPLLTVIESDPNSVTGEAWLRNHGIAIMDAERGDIEPLRRRLPHLAKFLHTPPSPKHKRKTGGYSLSWEAKIAADRVQDVNAIWKQQYGKKVRRIKPTTLEIVADIWGVDVKDVKLKLGRDKQDRHKKRREKVF